jgi:DNA-binding NtrC family response regulator
VPETIAAGTIVSALWCAERIVVVEDEAKVAKALRDGLVAERYEVRLATTGEERSSSSARSRSTWCCST